ncbi:hypothetical protein IW262DRAFT_1464908 [Armillaria fumosa]|nr:hypothetical protein IW262DRAFT_1464908 [Armillaria fumosa]
MSSPVAPVARTPMCTMRSKHKCATGSVQAKVEPVAPIPIVSTPVKKNVPPKKKSRVKASPASRGIQNRSLLPGGLGYADLPPVSVSRPGGVIRERNDHWLAYGELTPNEIAAVLQLHQRPAASDGVASQIPPATQTVAYAESDNSSDALYDADSDSVSAHPFIDDVAEELNRSTDAASSSDGEGYDSPSPSTAVSDVPAVPLSSLPNSPERVLRSSAHAKVRTEKGRYVNTLLADGHISDLAGDDNLRDDPNVMGSPATVTQRNTGAIQATAATPSRWSATIASAVAVHASGTPPKAGPTSADVFLEDLGLPPPSVRRRKTGRLFTVGGHHHPTPLPIIADASVAVEGSSLLSSVVKTLVVQKPIDVATSSGLSSVPVEDLTGIDDTPPSTKTAQGMAVKGADDPLFLCCLPTDDGDFFAMLDALIGDRCRDHESEPDFVVSRSWSDDSAPSAKPPPLPFNEPDDVTLCIMQPKLQESQLVPLYDKMPSIGEFRPVIALRHDPNTFEHPACISYDEIISFFSRDALRSFISYMQFTGHAPYCNLTTMPTTLFASDGRKALYASRTAVAMMVGMVMACHLYQPAWEGGYEIRDPSGISDPYIEGGTVYHSITVMPFRQLWCRETTMLSSIFKLPYMHCTSMTSNSPEFTTCSNVTHEDGPANKNKLPSPAQRKDTSSAHRSLNKLSSAGREYWHCLGFKDDVPIFDGRASKKHHFLFHPGDFDNLSSLPHYTPSRDLDYFTLVAVGSTPTVWCVKKRPCLNLNVQFVVVLGQAPNTAELASAGYVG